MPLLTCLAFTSLTRLFPLLTTTYRRPDPCRCLGRRYAPRGADRPASTWSKSACFTACRSTSLPAYPPTNA
ncbi:hypothetical protein GGS23DRAFT_571359 [Durotheca rogersii]|uniref:uncharacterized protein n=1 Tax=Durotheca rogersii TaxID=419775 RepID=UPI00222032EB|nr:uncharacterized protein GGS23DRAFT_571359 [Durotheca rogersii]KAI5862688.1 hypothetical protein GGS23DRAFT_571359 [Durotheca rogersii]